MAKVSIQYFSAFSEDIDFLTSALPTLKKEYDFWMKERGLEIDYLDNRFILNHYNSEINQPRPESYREDKKVAMTFEKGMCILSSSNVLGTSAPLFLS